MNLNSDNKDKDKPSSYTVYNATFYDRNKERIRQRNREYYAKNRERLRAYFKQYLIDNPYKKYHIPYYQKHKDKYKEYYVGSEASDLIGSDSVRTYYEKYKQRISEQMAKYYEDNKSEILEYSRKYYKNLKYSHLKLEPKPEPQVGPIIIKFGF